MLEHISHIHFDMAGGIAGDMFTAACIDAIPELEQEVLKQLAIALPASIGRPTIWAAVNGGMSVKRFALVDQDKMPGDGEKPKHSQPHQSQTSSGSLSYSNSYSDGARSHSHSHSHSDSRSRSSHSHTHHKASPTDTLFFSLKKRISGSDLKESVKDIAIAILEILALAEAKMHATTLDKVHFHELADWDSLMDVIAAAVILDSLELRSFSMSKIPLGGGLINTQHGVLPAPAPATVEILRGFEFIDDGVQGERVTPTGAAILRYLANTVEQKTAGVRALIANGYGAGQRTFTEMPNVLRVMAFSDQKTVEDEIYREDVVALIEFDIDDMTPEEMAVSLRYLRKTAGVIDVTVHTARGKKARSIEKVTIMASVSELNSVKKACFVQTSTLGLRIQLVPRVCLPREQEQASIDDKSIGLKYAKRPDDTITRKIESDYVEDLPSLALRRKLKMQAENSPNEENR